MRRNYWFIGVAALLLAGTALASIGKVPIKNLPVRGGSNDPIYSGASAPSHPSRFPGTLDTVGVAMTAGTTWNDAQHNGTAGHMIGIDGLGYVHMVWQKGLNQALSQRHVYYNAWNPTTSDWVFSPGNPTGQQIDNANRAGYACLALLPSGWVFPTFHEIRSNDPNGHPAVAMDYLPEMGAFTATQPQPYLYENSESLELIWPKVAIGIDSTIHIISTENPASGVAGDPQRIYYSRGVPTWDVDNTGLEIMWENVDGTSKYKEIDTVMVIAPTIIASKNSNRIAIVWSKSRDDLTNEPSQYNNDLYYMMSEDGGINWAPEENITEFAYPDYDCASGDTAVCNRDTFRVYTDCDALFDNDDNLHVAFTTCYLYEIEGLINIVFSDIWHWDALHQEFANVANGRFDSTYWTDPGAWQRTVQRPSLSLDHTTGYLYCAYHRLDEDQVSEGGWPLGDAYVTVSRNCGRSWSQAVNVTNTIWNTSENGGAPAGQCNGERDITVADKIGYEEGVGYLHMEYIVDLDAGTSVQEEGVATLNPVVYQKIPVNEILPLPIHDPFYPALHVDSTGFPGRTTPGWDPTAEGPCPTDAIGDNENPLLPASFRLYQNYPNPFNPVTNIQFDLARNANVTLKVFNTLGQEVATLFDGKTLNAGVQTISFDGANLASGVYVYRLEVNGTATSLKMVLMK